ncbi:hypothetical protein OIDMADRAFT_18411 [Oidiodendron maius Zn]|uniref:Uncharacterized protein n=1 Tax=Oidiodendron maius (strain Zn) TaxID=913774 RepID=A0A0C3HHS4_OIDMZ|nr:hypothetical protein OIDMADRAFT_18411 [Oidiodendron maius Zn]
MDGICAELSRSADITGELTTYYGRLYLGRRMLTVTRPVSVLGAASLPLLAHYFWAGKTLKPYLSSISMLDLTHPATGGSLQEGYYILDKCLPLKPSRLVPLSSTTIILPDTASTHLSL